MARVMAELGHYSFSFLLTLFLVGSDILPGIVQVLSFFSSVLRHRSNSVINDKGCCAIHRWYVALKSAEGREEENGGRRLLSYIRNREWSLSPNFATMFQRFCSEAINDYIFLWLVTLSSTTQKASCLRGARKEGTCGRSTSTLCGTCWASLLSLLSIKLQNYPHRTSTKKKKRRGRGEEEERKRGGRIVEIGGRALGASCCVCRYRCI